MEDSLHERGKSMEDAFFRQRDEELLRRLRSELDRQGARQVLAQVTGIRDESVLDQIISQKVNHETLLCFSLVPLVAVAWADGVIQDQERQAIARAARENGIAEGSAAAALLDAWLAARPPTGLVESWKAYVHALRGVIDQTAFHQLRNSVLQRTEDVASAAGGILGFAAVSESERRVLEDLRSAFA